MVCRSIDFDVLATMHKATVKNSPCIMKLGKIHDDDARW